MFARLAILAHGSAQLGSAITGAPGQPVDEGALRASIQLVSPTPTSAIIGTNLEYAKPIEDGIGPHGPLTLRSPVGGFHSFARTAANTDRLIAAAIAQTESSNG